MNDAAGAGYEATLAALTDCQDFVESSGVHLSNSYLFPNLFSAALVGCSNVPIFQV